MGPQIPGIREWQSGSLPAWSARGKGLMRTWRVLDGPFPNGKC